MWNLNDVQQDILKIEPAQVVHFTMGKGRVFLHQVEWLLA